MAGEWRVRKIGTLGRVVTGKTPSTRDPGNFGGNYPFITIPDLDGRVIIDETARTLSELGAGSIRGSTLPAGSVMISCIATVGKCGITSRVSFTNQQINSVIPGDDVNPRFLYYAFRQLGHELETAGGGGSVYTNVSKSRFSDLEVVLPVDLAEQEAIASILGALDDKIELNRRMSETLEKTVRAWFQAWFVDFTDGPAAESGIAAEVGILPAGWRTGTLGDVAVESRRGVNPSDLDPSTPYIGLEHMPRQRITLDQWGTAEGLGSGKLRFDQGEILFGKLRPYFHKVGVAPVDGVSSTDIVVLRPQAEAWYGFVLGVVSSVEFVQYTDAASTGTRMPRTNWRTMAAYEVQLPPPHVARAFDALTRPMVDRMIEATHESRTLGALRDTLLPKLISGELRVPDAERLVGEVA